MTTANIILGRAVQITPTTWDIALDFGPSGYIRGTLHHIRLGRTNTQDRGHVVVKHTPNGVEAGAAVNALCGAIRDGRIKCDPYLHNLLDLTGSEPKI